MDEITNGTIWSRDGKRYVVHNAGMANDGTVGLTTKDASAANWQRAVIYQDVEAEQPLRVRTAEDFREKYVREQ